MWSRSVRKHLGCAEGCRDEDGHVVREVRVGEARALAQQLHEELGAHQLDLPRVPGPLDAVGQADLVDLGLVLRDGQPDVRRGLPPLDQRLQRPGLVEEVLQVAELGDGERPLEQGEKAEIMVQNRAFIVWPTQHNLTGRTPES